MKKVFIEKISIINESNFKKGEVSLADGFNFIYSKENNEGKTLLASAVSYVLGNSENNVFMGIEPKDEEIVENLLIKVHFNLNNKKFVVIRKCSRNNLNDNKKIIILPEQGSPKEFLIGSQTKGNLKDFSEIIYKELGIPGIVSLNKTNEINLESFSTPYLSSILGFFHSCEESQNDEFKGFTDSEISTRNKSGVDGRIYTFLYLIGLITDEEGIALKNDFSFENQIIDFNKEINILNKVIEKLNSKFVFGNIDTENKDLSKFKKLSSKIYEIETHLSTLLDRRNKLTYSKAKLLKLNNDKNESIHEFQNFIEIHGNEEVKGILDDLNVVNVKISDLFPKKDFIDFYLKSGSNFEENLNQIEEDLRLINEMIKSKNLEVNNLNFQLKSVERPELASAIKKNGVELNEIQLNLKKELEALKAKKNKILSEKKEKNKLVKGIFEKLNISDQKIGFMDEIKDMLSGINAQWSNHLAINDFPRTKKEFISNTGSSKAAYSFSKLLFYINKINQVNIFSIIDFISSKDAGRVLNDFEETLLQKIVDSSIKQNKQLIIFRNLKEDNLFNFFKDKANFNYQLTNAPRDLISEELTEAEKNSLRTIILTFYN